MAQAPHTNPEILGSGSSKEKPPVSPEQFKKEQTEAREGLGFKPFDPAKHREEMIQKQAEQAKHDRDRTGELSFLEAELAETTERTPEADAKETLEKSLLTIAEIAKKIDQKQTFTVETNETGEQGKRVSVSAKIAKVFEMGAPENDTLEEITKRLREKKTTPGNITFEVDVDLAQPQADNKIRTIQFSLPIVAFLGGDFENALRQEVSKLCNLIVFAFIDYKKKKDEQELPKIESTDIKPELPTSKKEKAEPEHKIGLITFGENQNLSQINPRSESSVRLPVAFAVNNGDVWGVLDLDALEAKPVELAEEKPKK